MPTINPYRYVADHWLGRQSLTWSFWVNLVLLRFVIYVAQMWLRPAEGGDYSDARPAVLILAAFFHLVLFVWQVVGVVCAGEVHIRRRGSIANMWGAQAGILIAFWFTASLALEAWQMALPVPVEDDFVERMQRERAASYRIDVPADGRTVSISGTIALGITRSFSNRLKRHPDVQTVMLASDGGNIFEARGLSKLIRTNGLDTLVERQCNSACTTVFVGGRKRTLAEGAVLGFHQYRVEADYAVLGTNPATQQQRDRALYSEQGVKAWFLEKMFNAPPDRLWFPSTQELLSSGVVNHIRVRD